MKDLRPDVTVQAVTSGPRHHFFGYYDKTTWDATGRYLLALETAFMDRPPTPDDAAVVGIVDLQQGNTYIPLDETLAWNWQQGTMLQWLPTAPDRLVVYNRREADRFVAIIRDVHTGETRRLPRPIYAVSRDGRQAVTPNFSRLARTRPGYGYVGVPDPWADDPAPADDGIYRMDLETGESRLIISVAQIADLGHDETMDDAEHWFNHLQFCTDDSRFVFLHRWRRRGEKAWLTRMFTARPDGSEVYCLNDHEMTSHFDWRDANHMLAWATRHGRGDHYYVFADQAREVEVMGAEVLTTDGHCSYSPDGRWVLTDTYPDAEHRRQLLLCRPEDGLRVDLARFYAPPELEGEIRCDLHPRWNRDGTQVSLDSAHEGTRQVYVVDVSRLMDRR